MTVKKIGLALGGGGVRGLAHVLVLEALDDMGCRPSVIAGTSMGAIIGALYASGLSGKAIKERILEHSISEDETWRDVLKKRSHLLKWVESFAIELGRGGLLKTDRFLDFLLDEIGKTTFGELNIPLIVVAADYWKAEEVVFESGELLPAIKASMAVPGVFAPVSIGGRLLVDGGTVNQVPYDHLKSRCDVSIAVNVAKSRKPGQRKIPGVLESILGAFEIMQAATLAEKLKHRPPDIYVRPEIRDVAIFDFGKVSDVFRQAEPAIKELKAAVARKIGGPPKSRRGLLKAVRFPWITRK